MTAPLDPETLDRILHEAGAGPSPFDLQPWRFLVVREAKNRRLLGACAWNNPAIGRAEAVVVVLGYQHPERTHLDPVLERRRELGLSTPEQAAELQGRALATFARIPDPAPWATQWAMTAVANLIRAAESLGVAATPIDGFEDGMIRETFGVPDDHAIACLIALGVRLAEPLTERLGLDETCYAEHFGQPWTPIDCGGRGGEMPSTDGTDGQG
jgi:nitroreductase